MHQSSGDGGATEPLSTHPGYDERIKILTDYYRQSKDLRVARKIVVGGAFDFDLNDNLLSYKPATR